MALARGIIFGLVVLVIIVLIFHLYHPRTTHVVLDPRVIDSERPGFRKCGLCTDLSPCDTCGRHAAVAYSGQAAIIGVSAPDIADDFERVRSCNQRCGIMQRSWATNGVESRGMCFPGGSTAIALPPKRLTDDSLEPGQAIPTGGIPNSMAIRGSLVGRSPAVDLAAERRACSCRGECRCGINAPVCGELGSRDGDETTWDMLYGNNIDFRSTTLGDVCEYVGINGYRYKTACSY